MRPVNVIYLHSHDTGRYVRPYGHALDTPHFSRLAERGVLYRDAHCANPTCSPSRACLLTGRPAHVNGMMGLAHLGGRLADPGSTLPWFLHNHGYAVVLAGLQHVHHSSHGGTTADLGYTRDLNDERDVKGFEVHERDTATAQAAADFLAAHRGEPFFLDVGFYTTHRTGPIAPGSKVCGHNQPHWPLGDARYVHPPACLPHLPEVRVDFADYAAAVARLDGYLGVVLDALDRSPHARDTLVIATTDHGLAFPRMKCNLTAHGTGVLLIIAGPTAGADQPDFTGGRSVQRLVSHLDVFPTVCEATGLPTPEGLHGRSLVPHLAEPDDAIDEGRTLFAEVNDHARREPMRSARTHRYNYIRRLDPRPHPILGNIDNSLSKRVMHEQGLLTAPPAESLYDLLADPQEQRNLAEEPGSAEPLREMRGRLDAWMRDTDDPALRGPIDPPGSRVRPVSADDYSP